LPDAKSVQKGQNAHAIFKAKHTVGQLRKSSVIAEKLVNCCAKMW